MSRPMFECHACLRRCLKALIASCPPPPYANASSIQHSSRSVARYHTSSRRTQAQTAVATATNNDHSAVAWSNARRGQSSVPERTSATGRKTWAEVEGQKRKDEVKGVLQGKNPKRLEIKYLQTELKYLKDPVKLADHIRNVLEANDEEKAQALCRLSGRALANTVSWNHLIDWQMKQGKTQAALHTYNEMKKRAQKPDNVTYTLMLRGLANFAHYPGSLGRALSLYHGMTGPNSKIQPNINHVNAVIKVCARCNDMDSLWDIVSKLPDRGPLAADSWTFTTIFNHMRYSAVTSPKAGDLSEAAKRETSIVKARQMWSVVVARWRQGEFKMEEETMCAMGRLLLVGSQPRDWDDVLSLVEQTTQIARLIPRLDEQASNSDGSRNNNQLNDVYSPTQRAAMLAAPGQDAEKEKPSSEFDNIDSATSSTSLPVTRRSKYFYVTPDRQTLTMVTEACYKLAQWKAARKYWKLFTDPEGYAIIPDLACVHMLLRVLRASRSAASATQLVVEHLPVWRIRPTGLTYCLALRSCIRAHRDPVTMDQAGKLLENMMATLTDPDIPALDAYMELATTTRRVDAACKAVEQLEPIIVNLRSFLNFGPTRANQSTGSQKRLDGKQRQEGVELMQKVIGCYDWIMRPENGIDGKKRQVYMQRKARLAAFVTRYRNQWLVKERGPKKWGPSGTGFDVLGVGRSEGEDAGEVDDAGEEREVQWKSQAGSGIEELEKHYPDTSSDVDHSEDWDEDEDLTPWVPKDERSWSALKQFS